MKTLSTMIASSLLLATMSASAFTGHDVLETPVAATKAAAYEMGINKLSSLNNSNPRQLMGALNTPLGDIEERSLRLKDGYVSVEERVYADGQARYVGLVNVNIEFERDDNDN